MVEVLRGKLSNALRVICSLPVVISMPSDHFLKASIRICPFDLIALVRPFFNWDATPNAQQDVSFRELIHAFIGI